MSSYPPHPEDPRLAEALRARRPGAVGHVYNVHGPELFAYAHALLGERERAVEAVRAALLSARARPEAVPGPEGLSEWLYELVRSECVGRIVGREPGPSVLTVPADPSPVQIALTLEAFAQAAPPEVASAEHDVLVAARTAEATPPAAGTTVVGGPLLLEQPGKDKAPPPAPVKKPADGRGRTWGLAGATGIAAVVLTSAILLLPDSSGYTKPQAGAPTGGTAMEPPAALPTATPSATPSKSPEASESPTPKPTESKKKKKKKQQAPSGPGRLSVSDGGCRGVGVAGLPNSCTIRLTARGGTVRWSVSSVSSGVARVSASGGGSLRSGASTTVTVTVWPTVRCYIRGGGSGSVGFSPGGAGRVSYTCWRR